MQTRKGNDRGERSHGGWRVTQARRDRLRPTLTQTDRQKQSETERDTAPERAWRRQREKETKGKGMAEENGVMVVAE